MKVAEFFSVMLGTAVLLLTQVTRTGENIVIPRQLDTSGNVRGEKDNNTFSSHDFQCFEDTMDDVSEQQCPLPYNTMIDVTSAITFGGPVGLGIYTGIKVLPFVLKKFSIKYPEQVNEVNKKYKEMEKIGRETIAGGTKQTRNNPSYTLQLRKNIAISIVWLLRRAIVSGVVLGSTWALHKYVFKKSVKQKLGMWDRMLTDPVFNAIIRFKGWRANNNRITRFGATMD